MIAMARGGEIDLTDEERELLRRGLLEWGGPARCTEAMAVAIGFSSVTDLLDEGRRIADDLLAGRALMKNDWRRALLATEIVFVSDVLGSGVDWSTTTGKGQRLSQEWRVFPEAHDFRVASKSRSASTAAVSSSPGSMVSSPLAAHVVGLSYCSSSKESRTCPSCVADS